MINDKPENRSNKWFAIIEAQSCFRDDETIASSAVNEMTKYTLCRKSL